MLIADSGAIYAFYDGSDQYHKLVREIINKNAGKIIVPDLILVEIDYLLGHLLDVQAELDFLQDVLNDVYRLHRISSAVLQRCYKLIDQYQGLKFCSVFGISVGTLRHWEQGLRTPRGPAHVLLKVVQHNPVAIIEAMKKPEFKH